jgi:anti-anti-sigma factor
MNADILKKNDVNYELVGSLGFKTVNYLENKANRVFDFTQDLIIDCKSIQHSDSAGIALLTLWAKRAAVNKRYLKLMNASDQIKNLIRLVALDELFASDVNG